MNDVNLAYVVCVVTYGFLSPLSLVLPKEEEETEKAFAGF